MKKIIALTVAVLMLCLSLASCGLTADKVFEMEELQITLNGMFKEEDGAWINLTSGVVPQREAFSELAGTRIDKNSTLAQYADALIEANGYSSEIKTVNDLVYFEYEETVDGTDFTYMAVIYKSSEAFWAVHFFCLSEDYEKKQETFFKFAESVTFTR